MNRFKLLSVILAVLLAGYCAVSVALFGQLHDEIDRAESRCRLLESERDELAEQTADVRQDVDTQPSSMNGPNLSSSACRCAAQSGSNVLPGETA